MTNELMEALLAVGNVIAAQLEALTDAQNRTAKALEDLYALENYRTHNLNR